MRISGKYLGNKKVQLVHSDSGAEILTDAPKDNNGDGSQFSPTDLFAASLGACMVTVMAIAGERRGLVLPELEFTVVKEMAANPRRVGAITVQIELPPALGEEERAYLEEAARSCPVHHSLHPDTKVMLSFK